MPRAIQTPRGSEEIVKTLDGPWAARVVAPVAWAITRRLVPTRTTPNAVTGASFVLALVAAWTASLGGGAAAFAAVVALQASFVLDMVDGQLARATGAMSRLGGFLDRLKDRVAELLVYAGVAHGVVQAGGDAGIWPLAYGAAGVILVRSLALNLLARHFGVDENREIELARNGLLTRGLRRAGFDDRAQGRGILLLVKSFLWFGIGERFLLLSIALLAGRPDLYFASVLVIMAPVYAARFVQKLGRVL